MKRLISLILCAAALLCLCACGSDPKMAEIMIRSNTNAMIRNHRQINRSSGHDSPVLILAQKMLDCETAHIRRLQQYL